MPHKAPALPVSIFSPELRLDPWQARCHIIYIIVKTLLTLRGLLCFIHRVSGYVKVHEDLFSGSLTGLPVIAIGYQDMSNYIDLFSWACTLIKEMQHVLVI